MCRVLCEYCKHHVDFFFCFRKPATLIKDVADQLHLRQEEVVLLVDEEDLVQDPQVEGQQVPLKNLRNRVQHAVAGPLEGQENSQQKNQK